MLLDSLKAKFPGYQISIDRDIIEIKTQKDSVFFVTSEFFGFKIYVGYSAPNSIDFNETCKIIEATKDAINPERRTI